MCLIAVGNLSVGGTGKTPQIEYLIRLLSVNYNVATLSRGYKRKSEGFIRQIQMLKLGDEPFNFIKIQEHPVAVDAIGRTGSNNYFRKSKNQK
jgi:tetraacyldisaccharide 4'-kinase